MKKVELLYSQAKKISEEIRRIQAVAESWPDKKEAGQLLRQRDELQLILKIYMNKIYYQETITG